MQVTSLPMDEHDSPPPEPASEVFDSGRRTIVDLAHVRVERLDTDPVLFSKVFKQVEDSRGQKYDYRYWAERENFFLREFLKKKQQFSHVVQPRHLISENEAAKQVLTCDAGVTVANWLRVKPHYSDGATLSHPFQRADAWLRLLRACLLALRQIHLHGIVHCDIKEDNICLPYAPYSPHAPYPRREAAQAIHLEFDKLKLIDFAFSIAQWMPLTQILIINPEDRAPYQSARLVEALHADRQSGSPNSVQQLDYRVDLFSLGYMAEKIMAGGLHCPFGMDSRRVLASARSLVQRLKASDTTPLGSTMPHDTWILEIEDLLADTPGFSPEIKFDVAGEWTESEMRPGRPGVRKTPLTPVAPPVPTPVALPAPLAPATPNLVKSPVYAPAAGTPGIAPWRLALGIILGMILALLAALTFLKTHKTAPAVPPAAVSKPAPSRPALVPAPAPVTDAYAQVADRLAKQLRDEDDKTFQSAWSELASFIAQGKPAAISLASAAVTEYGDTLNAAGNGSIHAFAYRRLQWLAGHGSAAAAERVAAFEKSYDQIKQSVATSIWWTRGQGTPPAEAARWMESGAVLAASGDRPAMLDQAFAYGYGRAVEQNRALSVQTYLNVIARAQGSDQASARIRTVASHGLAVMLNQVVAQKDIAAAKALQPVLGPRAAGGAADMQYYLGLFSECVLMPHDLASARQWYRQASADAAWKSAAYRKLASLGKSCPAPG
jgi:serine/threonine protein kinase